MKRLSDSLNHQGVVHGTISFYTYLDAAYSGLNNFLHRQSRLFNAPHYVQALPVHKQHYRAKNYNATGAAAVAVPGTRRSPAGIMHRKTG